MWQLRLKIFGGEKFPTPATGVHTQDQASNFSGGSIAPVLGDMGNNRPATIVLLY